MNILPFILALEKNQNASFAMFIAFSFNGIYTLITE